MKKLKKALALLVVAGMALCSGCGSSNAESISPVEDSGKRIEGTHISAAMPEGWEDKGSTGAYDGFVLGKGILNSAQAIVMDSAISEEELEGFVDQIKASVESLGMTPSVVETREYEFGKGIFAVASGEITQEVIDSNIQLGLCTEKQAKQMQGLVGKNKNEAMIYFIKGNKMICVDVLTMGDDAAGVEEMAEFLGNSLEYSEQ